MIVYDLICDGAHRFEGWFGSSEDFADQAQNGLLSCPVCASEIVTKAPMAPAVAAKGNSDRSKLSAIAAKAEEHTAAQEASKTAAQAKKTEAKEAKPSAGKQAEPSPQAQSEPAMSSAHPVANQPMPPEVAKAFAALAKAQAKALEKSEYVGKDFAEEARSMHYGEKDAAPIHGQATREEAEDLIDEGVAVAPLIVPVAPPDKLN
jgi:hypothetical protein